MINNDAGWHMASEVKTTTLTKDNTSGLPDLNLNLVGVRDFFSNFPKKLCEHVGLQHKRLKSDDHAIKKLDFPTWSNKDVSSLEFNSERLLKAWKDNPNWVDHPPVIKVTIPKGSLSNLSLTVDVGLPPDAVYDIVTDPDNKRVFKNIKEVISRKVLVDEGLRQVVEVEQAAIWRFLWLTGTISIHVLVDQNREDYTMKFKQIKSGFMERFEGQWRVEPLLVDQDMLCGSFKPKSLADYVSFTKGRGRVASRLSLEQLVQPSVVPPPPISWYLRGITTKTTEMLINDLVAEAARIRQSGKCVEQEAEESSRRDIKERWALRRRNAVRHTRRRRSFLNQSLV